MRQGFLKLTLADYEYGTGELFAEAETGGFAGRASAYFDIFRIEEFANAISEYPLPLRQRCSLASGFGPPFPEPLHEEHLSIEVYQIDRAGHIGIQIRMATPLWNDTRLDSQRTVKLEVLTTYEPLARFSRDLLAVVKGTVEEAVLDEEMIP